MTIPHPTEVNYVEGEQLLRITFSDDVVREFPTAFLRGFCPCARCQGHGGGPATWTPWTHESAIRVDNVTPVGNYAMCIVWGDGHDTGIYSFELLRRMQPDEFSVDDATPETEVPLVDAPS